jgi:hypothetical protein
MKKQLGIAAGVLLTLGTAVSAPLNDYSEPAKPMMTVESAALEMDSKQSAQIVTIWSVYASSSGSVRLARPL